MYGPFILLLVGVGAPAAVVVYSLLFLNNLQAGLTHYGTTTATGHLYRGLRELPRLVAGRVLRVGA